MRRILDLLVAIRIKPDHASAHYFLGKALAGQGKLDEAIAEIRNARENAPRGSELAQLIEKALNKLDFVREPQVRRRRGL
jgi:tetratricopeptide (TPR) repeat protein